MSVDEVRKAMQETEVLREQLDARSDALFKFVEEYREYIPGQFAPLIVDHTNANVRLVTAMARVLVLATRECSINQAE